MKKTVIVFLVLLSHCAFSQSKISALGVSAKVGAFGNHKAGGPMGELSIFGKVGKHYTEISVQRFIGDYDFKLPRENYWLYGAYYGRAIPGTKDKIIYAGGFGLVRGVTRGDFWFEEKVNTFYEKDKTLKYYYQETVVMPVWMLKLEARFPWVQVFDVRTSVFANLTYKVPSFGLSIGFGFGKVREKKK